MATASRHPLNVTTHWINQPTPTKERFHQREKENPQPQSTAQPTTNHYNQPPNQPTHTYNPKPSNQPKPTNQLSTHKSTQHPQINLHHEINPHPQLANLDQLGKTQPHLECLMSSVALAVKATLREHVYDTFVSIYLIGVTLIK